MKSLIRKILKESLLVENRVDTVFEKYKDGYYELYVDGVEMGYIKDSSSNIEKNAYAFFGGVLTYNEDLIDSKYLDWFIKTYLQQWERSGIIPPERHIGLYIEKINDFHTNLPKIKTEGFKNHLKELKNIPIAYRANEDKILNNISDINIYPDFMTLRFVVEESENYVTPSQKKKIVKEETNKIYEDDNVLIIEPLSEASSCMYGSGTKWCTAAKHGNQFGTYKNKTSTLIYVIGKTNEMVVGKWALHLGYEIALSDDFGYCLYTLYNDEDTDVDGGHYYGKGDLDEPLRAWVGLHDGPYRAVENFYNTRLREIEDTNPPV